MTICYILTGLSGNTSSLRVGGLYNLMPNLRTDITCDIRDELLRYCHDSFIIGAGYAARPSMLYNGVVRIIDIFKRKRTYWLFEKNRICK